MPSFTFSTRVPIPNTAKELQDRLKSLFIIKDELDREIETLIGRKADHAGNLYHCLRCDYKWNSRLMRRPNGCPKCRTKKFDIQPAYTYEEKLRRKQERLARNEEYLVKKWAVPQPPDPGPLPHSVLTRSISEEPIALTPPPAPDRPLSLRERLAQLAAQPPPEPQAPAPEPVIVEASEDQLVEAINGEDDAT